VDDFAAYERQTRRLLAGTIGWDPAAEVYREPVGHGQGRAARDLLARLRSHADDNAGRGGADRIEIVFRRP
jgi:hypothetical protein